MNGEGFETWETRTVIVEILFVTASRVLRIVSWQFVCHKWTNHCVYRMDEECTDITIPEQYVDYRYQNEQKIMMMMSTETDVGQCQGSVRSMSL
jgi:hypothetical protein